MPADGKRGGRRSQKSETRISAIADFAGKGKRETKALTLFPRSVAGGGNLRPGQMEKLVPQPHEAVATGLFTLNEAPIRSST